MEAPRSIIKQRRTAAAVTVLLGLLGVAAIAAAAIGLLRFSTDGVQRIPFEPAAWRANPVSAANAGVRGSLRQRMSDDLIAQELLLGLTREQVIDLLGPPTWTPGHTLSYALGDERGQFAMDVESLDVVIEGGRVVSAKIVSH